MIFAHACFAPIDWFMGRKHIIQIYASMLWEPLLKSPPLLSAFLCFTQTLPGLLLTLPFERILFTNVKDCNFNLMRFKILCRIHMIYFLSYKLSSIITFYFMNTTPMPKLTQCSLIGNEKNCENIKHRPWFINMPVGSGVKTELSRKLCYQSWFES